MNELIFFTVPVLPFLKNQDTAPRKEGVGQLCSREEHNHEAGARVTRPSGLATSLTGQHQHLGRSDADTTHSPFMRQIFTCRSSAPDTIRGIVGWKAAQFTPRS